MIGGAGRLCYSLPREAQGRFNVAFRAAAGAGKGRFDRTLALGALILAVAAVIGVSVVLRFTAAERQRDLTAWQVRLGIVADSRFAAVESWLAAQQEEMTALADNASLQLYLSQIAAAGDEAERDALAMAQLDYLRNLLVVSAERAGFAPPAAGPAVRANVERVGVAGLALVDASGRAIVATPGMPPVEGALAAFVRGLPPGERSIMDMHLNAAGRPAMAFAAPVFAVQTDPGAADQIGYVLGVKEVADELYPLLRQPGKPRPAPMPCSCALPARPSSTCRRCPRARRR
jgi:hypothetical protein